MNKALLIIIILFISDSTNAQSNIQKLADWMAGTYSSSEQAKLDTSYRDISLSITPIWKNKSSKDYWFYVEQAVTSMKNKPYRQRVYHLKQIGRNKFESEVYTLKCPQLCIGKPEFVDNLPDDSMDVKTGCSVYLIFNDAGYFDGSTHENDCPSELYGASYATSSVKVFQNRLESWDRGFNKDGNQVWGAEKGGYIFRKAEK